MKCFKLIDQKTGAEIEFELPRKTIRSGVGNKSWCYVTGFDPPSRERAQGRVRYKDPRDDSEHTANPSFFEAKIVEIEPAKVLKFERAK